MKQLLIVLNFISHLGIDNDRPTIIIATRIAPIELFPFPVVGLDRLSPAVRAECVGSIICGDVAFYFHPGTSCRGNHRIPQRTPESHLAPSSRLPFCESTSGVSGAGIKSGGNREARKCLSRVFGLSHHFQFHHGF